ncbi:MAG: hypothetical protein A2147_10040 [Chloroflexi bacterium RBG_16_57_8]|nr:MAG: hypothetical protein A2147_10040 [Chloroflexi bacterium RBG_16_57_8]
MKSLSFDGMTHLYDETRVFNPACFRAALDHLVERFPPQRYHHVFKPGIGTGRIAIPLARKGYRITGVDISDRMLGVLRRRLARSKKPLQVSCQIADVTELPFPDGAFDMAVAVHLFYFISEWKKAADEIMRVVKPGHPLVLMHTGTGMEIPLLNERYRELCAQHAHGISDIGASSTAEVLAYFKIQGCRTHPVRERWHWTSRIRLENALSYVESRAYSFTSFAPDDIHLMVMERLMSEAKERFGSLATEVEVPNQIYYVVVTRR